MWSSAVPPLAFAAIILVSVRAQSIPPSCPSQIYCQGGLLHDVQLARIFNDSKTFVDKKIKTTPEEVLERYESLKQNYTSGIPKDILQEFVEENFEDGNELEEWVPSDWTDSPPIASIIEDENLANWTLALNDIWKTLSRKVSEDAEKYPEKHSLIYTPNGFVIPGGRFKELYYWDTYWIIKGLLLCGMQETAKGMILNLVWLVKKLGHVPNGSRVYYMQRSQPPMLVSMVEAYLTATNDFKFVADIYEVLDKEMEWWINNRGVEVVYENKKYQMFRYYAPSSGPRPESYREDYNTVSVLNSDKEKVAKYISLKSGAESGWDFSSRWIILDGTNKGNLTDIHTEMIVPVDLNSILQKSFTLMMEWSAQLRNRPAFIKYKKLSFNLLKSINTVLWQEKPGIWLDWDMLNEKPRNYFYLSNIVPLWADSFQEEPEILTKPVIKYLLANNITHYIGGTPTSVYNTGEQWDYPNAWPPLQAFLVQGLLKLNTKSANELAAQLANIWICNNYEGYTKFNAMFEKYNSELRGQTGGGGEYTAQTGFGWTNGVALEFLNQYPKTDSSKCPKTE